MRGLSQLAAPMIAAAAALAAALRGVDVYAAMTEGAKKGLLLLWGILPSLLVLFPAIAMFRASGLPELLGGLLRPAFSALRVPEETARGSRLSRASLSRPKS